MSISEYFPFFHSLDRLVFNLDSLKGISELSAIVTSYLNGDYKPILQNATSQAIFKVLSSESSNQRRQQDLLNELGFSSESDVLKVFISGLAAFAAFLQCNVTGPVIDLRGVLITHQDGNGKEKEKEQREAMLRSLDIDGVSVYQYIPNIELFCLARMVFTVFFPRIISGDVRESKWMKIRVNAYHQRLLAGVSVGRVISLDSGLLMEKIEDDFQKLEKEIFSASQAEIVDDSFGRDEKVMFLLEKAQIYIAAGLEYKAKESVERAAKESGFVYQLSGALGKRTRFQTRDISQLVVFAKSKAQTTTSSQTKEEKGRKGPEALELNDDTVLESISFAKEANGEVQSTLPAELADLRPDEQPQLDSLDQITLLTEATLKDNLSPLDKLNSEEILPFAVRVLTDKPTNWQIYTQALLVRSRIESHRSRTMERSVLQLQVIVDQIIADTQEPASSTQEAKGGVPEIRVAQFLPRAKADESAPVQERLRYIFQLNTPTRWEVETELAFAWSNAGSLVSALEIFKRLKLWPEVALCYFSVGQEDKARQIVRRQLYQATSNDLSVDDFDVDAQEVISEKWEGEIREPPPAHAPRLWCILGDLDQDPECWERAWTISKNRYARAQRTLGEYYGKKRDLEKSREAYMKATVVNRQNGDTWSRLGDIDLAVGNWDGAIIAFQQAIMIDETNAKTYSNLGTALLSKSDDLITLQKTAAKDVKLQTADGEEVDTAEIIQQNKQEDPKELLKQALSAFKRGASQAHDNWKIWDNVITIASRLSPPSYPDLLLGLRAVIQIRAPTIGEEAIDIPILRALVQQVTTTSRPENTFPSESESSNKGIYIPPRGSLARALITLFSTDIIPLITHNPDLWLLVEKLKIYQKDYKEALACAERAWRMSMAGDEWERDEKRWEVVVDMTDHLVSAYENFGEGNWRAKARSAVRGVLGKGRDAWEGSEGWVRLEGIVEALKSS